MKVTLDDMQKFGYTSPDDIVQLISGRNAVKDQRGKHLRTLKYVATIAGFMLFLLFVSMGLLCGVGIFNIRLKHMRSSLYSERDSNYDCNLQLVESIPLGMKYNPESPLFLSTFEAWKLLLNSANVSLDLGSFYWTMRGVDVVNDSSAAQGEEVFQHFLASDKKFKLRIAQSQPTESAPNIDTEILKNYGAAEVVSVNFQKYFGSGVLHTKLWIVDNRHFYLGSANMDWRALTQVKELGILALNCPELAKDVAKIFGIYWHLGSNPDQGIPNEWPYEYRTNFNMLQPMPVRVNKNYTMHTFLSSSPPPLSAKGRTHDLDAILNTINTAVSFINIAVMDYIPMIVYEQKLQYWPVIDNALRKAAIERKVAVKMLISWWKHSRPSEDYFLRSLQDLSHVVAGVDIQIRRFVVPADGNKTEIPFSRVNHNKYMVTDSIAYIGTSNWSGDYFIDTAGIALVMKDTIESATMPSTVRTSLLSIFERDWNSVYAKKLLAQNEHEPQQKQ